MELKKIKLPFRVKKAILALGTQTKNTLCFAKGNCAYLSPVYADLNNPQDFSNFKKAVKYFLKKRPKIIASDLHPEYQSSKYALNLKPNTYHLIAIQHHHAHIASCMAENGLKNQKVIGVAFDGTGLGDDNTLWGAEFLICDYRGFRRKAHLKEIPLLGGQRAITEPARVTAAWLYLIYKDRFLGLLKGMPKDKWRVLKNMYSSGFNSPLASSMGRLFDAAASLILEKPRAHFEAELAIELEQIAIRYPCLVGRQGLLATCYKFKITNIGDRYILDPRPVFGGIIADLKARRPKKEIAYKFHLSIAELIRKTCLILRKQAGINKVVLSGGVFQNNLLLCLSKDLLYKDGFSVFTHNNLSCNDSAVSLGQIAIANFRNSFYKR